MATHSSTNFQIFRDCLSEVIKCSTDSNALKESKISASKKKRAAKKRGALPVTTHLKQEQDFDMVEFVEYLATEIFDSLPTDLRHLSYSTSLSNPLPIDVSSYTDIETVASAVPHSVTDSLSTYHLPELTTILLSVLPSYVSAAAAAPPVWVTTRPDACELCLRSWIPLTYHHLIPRSTHERVLRRGWHEEWELNKVAWLCGACHRCVHRVATNEELAQYWHTVESLLQREDIQRWVGWIGGVRWKKR